MKIVTYNLRCGGKIGHRIHWRKIFAEADPDIFLVQESCVPSQYMSPEFCNLNQDNHVMYFHPRIGNH